MVSTLLISIPLIKENRIFDWCIHSLILLDSEEERVGFSILQCPPIFF